MADNNPIHVVLLVSSLVVWQIILQQVIKGGKHMIELLIWAVYLVGVFYVTFGLEYSKPQVEDNWFLGLFGHSY